ncbi:DUF1492 domain-containing protein [Streptococcus sp. H49]|uniref:DUF1492 domain-containing protein n=1 Tax=Streptococcus huangxiaojuni TaxID=3237239 RepID=UPI0034A2DC57
MAKELTPAEKMLNELRIIPKMITVLKQDLEATRSAVLASPQWSDMKVLGGVKKTQEDKNIAIVDLSDYNSTELKRLVERKAEIIDTIMHMPDMVYRHVLLITYVSCNSYEEAMDKLEINNRNKYFMLKRKATKSLDNLLKKSVFDTK